MSKLKNLKSNKAITLIALIITIIVMLVLVAVSVSILVESDLIGSAEKTGTKYTEKQQEEQTLGQITVGNQTYDSINDYINTITGEETQDQTPGAIFNDGTILNWEELKLNENGTKYGYNNSAISNTNIGDQAFYECTSLTSINIPNSITSIGQAAFCFCTSLTSINIPEGVTSIGYGAFAACNGLASITVDPNNPVYHSSGNCIIETESKTLLLGCTTSVIPTDGSVTSIGDGAFANCDSLTSIDIPDSVTSIGQASFGYCTGLTSIELPDSVTSINEEVFYNCRSLTSIDIPDSVTSIGFHAFAHCDSLTSICIPDGVTSIGFGAFYKCTGLTSLELPDSVTSIRDSAFSGCTSLTNITFNGTCEQWRTISTGQEVFSFVPATYIQCSDGTITL